MTGLLYRHRRQALKDVLNLLEEQWSIPDRGVALTISELVSMADAYRVIDGDLPVMVATASDLQPAFELQLVPLPGDPAKRCLVIVSAVGKTAGGN